ncbi:MAG: hypothetical protein Q8R96_11715 [Bacteroidota bacterium]|nr:hypothetical protein [Bacteroidota bacterium]
MAGVAADPVTAIAQAAGSMFETWGKGLDVINTFFQKGIVREQNKGLALLNENERIRYDQLITNGNYAMASNLLAVREGEENSKRMNTYIIIGFTFLIVMVIIIVKSKKK